MTNLIKNVASRGSLYSFGLIAPIFVGTFLIPQLTRRLGPVDYSSWAFSWSLMSASIGIFALGLPAILTRHTLLKGSNALETRGLIVLGSVFALTLASICSFVAIVALKDVPTGLAILTGGVFSVLLLLQSYLVARDKPLTFLALAFGTGIAAPGFGLLIVINLSDTTTAYFAALLIAAGVEMCLGLGILIWTRGASYNLHLCKITLRMSLPLVPSFFAVASGTSVFVILAQITLPSGFAGLIQVSLFLASAPLFLISALSNWWNPYFLKAPKHLRTDAMKDSTLIIVWITSFLAVLIATIAPWVLRILVPPESFDIELMASLVAIACMAPLFAVPYTASLLVVLESGSTRLLSFSSPLALALGALVALASVQIIGPLSIALGLVLTYVILYALTRLIANSVSLLRWNDSRMQLTILIAFIACLISAVLPVSGSSSIFQRLLLFMCFTLVMAVSISPFIIRQMQIRRNSASQQH